MDINRLMNKQKGSKGYTNHDLELEKNETIEEEPYTDNDILQLVSFLIDDVEYGVDILVVHEILKIPDITRLPNTPNFIKGVINLRGNVIPVVDARRRFGFPDGKIDDLTRIIVLQNEEKKIGLMVDNVYQVVRIPKVNVDTPSELIEGVSEEFISGIGRLKDRLIIILNIANIIFLEEEMSRMDSAG